MKSSAHADLHHVLSIARKNSYSTNGEAWRELIASLVFEIKCDLSLIEYFDEQEQAMFFSIMDAFMSKELRVEEISSVYLEFFQHPEDWVEPQEN